MKNLRKAIEKAKEIIGLLFWLVGVIILFPFYKKDIKDIMITLKEEITKTHSD